ncbi:hypothetical protein PIB30_095481, partial [Stylosanthes scabra]|nr:hypothetical protein [Stylosanthes scabra]
GFQKGQIGIALNSAWIIPLSQSKADKDAASRALAFSYDWFMEPLNFGSYPASMVKNVGKRLPEFSREQSLMVKGSFDFIGVNYYTSSYAADVPCTTQLGTTMFTDPCVFLTSTRDGVQIGPQAGSDWLYIYPRGIQDLLLYTKDKYNNPIVYITENGVDEVNESIEKSVDDSMRINFFSDHLSNVHSALQNGSNVKGYFAWSLLDNFEWAEGYTVRFGMIYVDYNDGLHRHPKTSSQWFKKFLH